MAEKLQILMYSIWSKPHEVIANKTGANVNDVFFAEQAPSKLAKTLEVSEDSVFHYKQAPNLLANEYVGEEPPTPVTLVSIAVTTPPTKITYAIGEELDITGMVVTGTYSDFSTKVETVTKDNVTGFNSAEAGEKVCTVTGKG